MIESIAAWPVERQERIWAVGLPGETLARFGDRGIPEPSLARRPFDLGFVLGRLALGRAAGKAHADVLHATDPLRPWLPPRVRRIVTAYDLIPVRETAMMASWRPHDRLIYRRYLKLLMNADLIIAISTATADDLVEILGIARERIHIVYPVVRAGPPLPRTSPSEPTFLYVGALDMHKQPELAVQALAAFRRAEGAGRLRFIGPSSPAERTELLRLAELLGVAAQVTIEGRIPDQDLDAAYASATAFLATSRVEGFGLPAVEAIFRGIPVVAVDIAATRETLSGAATLTPADPGAIAAAMATPRPADATIAETLRDRFSAIAAGEALWAVYEQALT
jgi:glycosyltransferase involved in cell wall biosynthesis